VRTETTSSSSPWSATFADESHSGPEAENSRVSTVTTTPKWSFKSLWKKKAKSTPEMQDSVGTLVGVFNQESWWMVTGKALEDFKSIQEELMELLNDKYGNSPRGSPGEGQQVGRHGPISKSAFLPPLVGDRPPFAGWLPGH
jgi:hypothetical protein